MIFIKHRCNSKVSLTQVEPNWGVEIDLRSDAQNKGSLFLSHDPYQPGESFIDWLGDFKKRGIKGPLILNTKEDGLEFVVIQALVKFEIQNFIFLDPTIPTLVKWTIDQDKNHFMVRVSKYESAENALKFKNKVQWAWVDCFQGTPLPDSELEKIKGSFKICLVSPELHGRPIDVIQQFKSLTKFADAICTKEPAKWKQLLNL